MALATYAAVGCGGSSSSDDDSGGKSGSSGTGGAMASGGTGGTAMGGSTSQGGSGGSSNGGASGKGGSASGGTSGKGGSASGGTSGKGGSSGTGGSAGSDIPITTECPAFTACGGDVVGTWKIASVCGQSSGTDSLPACAGGADSTKLSGDAAITFGDDGSVTTSGTLAGSIDISIDDACAMSQQDGATAAQLCPLLEAILGGNLNLGTGGTGGGGGSDTPPLTADCSVTTGVCDCHVSFPASATTPTADMYTLAANQITLSDGTVYDYCVSGDTLTLRDATDQSQFVLKRQ